MTPKQEQKLDEIRKSYPKAQHREQGQQVEVRYSTGRRTVLQVINHKGRVTNI